MALCLVSDEVNGMRRAPPDLGREAVAQVAERLDRTREQQRLAERDDLRLEALLARLRQEGLRVGGITTPVTISTSSLLNAAICAEKSWVPFWKRPGSVSV